MVLHDPARPFVVGSLTPEPDEDGQTREALVADTRPLATLLSAVERALRDERLPDSVILRVVNRLLWGDPEGYVAVRQIEDERAEAEMTIDPEMMERGKAEARRTLAEVGLTEPVSAYVHHAPDGDQILHPADVSEVRMASETGEARS